ncbi:MAG: rhomboid family intramembrane serine protease [candidate division Zixibacteria bacterium CG_4_9_14_3_um_filter_46_8]|nr:MAG: rhomboid family intramembrane serine protease [candidate division Zixibacteria bacterium CG_4_9_14_3_um_filter_46_8]
MLPLRDNIPTERLPIVTVALIIVNTAVFLYQLSLGQESSRFIYNYGMIPYLVSDSHATIAGVHFPSELTFLTSMFLHGSWLHLIGNMIYLWIFGNNIEDRLGHLVFIVFYISCGILASMTHLITAPHSQIPTVGASGAIAGILGAYILKFPRARILTLIWLGFFVRTVYIPAIFVLGFWFLIQLISGLPTLGTEQGAGVAYFAHIGGFVAGMALFPALSFVSKIIKRN